MRKLTSPLSIVISPQTRERFEEKVRGEGKTISEVIRKCIDDYLKPKTSLKTKRS